MTIISSVYVPEGIVLATDSRLTGHIQHDNGDKDRFNISDNAQKLILVRDSSIGVAFCGDAIIESKTVADFIRVFDIEKVLKSDTVQKVAEKLKKYLSETYSEYDVSFFIAGFDNDLPFLFTISKHECTRSNFNEDLIYGASWRGQTEPVSKLLLETPFNFNLMPLKDAVELADFIVELTIKYYKFSDQISTCGGPIDILVITKDYTDFFRHKIFKP